MQVVYDTLRQMLIVALAVFFGNLAWALPVWVIMAVRWLAEDRRQREEEAYARSE